MIGVRAAGRATRDRILEAAKDEFTEYGFAGARLNRIATTARASKERLYSYFASKEQLFEAVVAQWIEGAPYRVALTADDVPGYVEALFDNLIADPRGARLQRWIELEAPRGCPTITCCDGCCGRSSPSCAGASGPA